MYLMSTWPNQEEFSSALHKFSTHGNIEAGEENQSASKQRYTLWQLHIAMQNQDGDLAEFFAHEIQSFAPSLSDFGGKLHLTRYEVWAAPMSWAAWTIRATFSARLHSPGWCRHRSLPTHYQLQHLQWVRRQRMLCGTHTYETAWRSQPAEREERMCTGKWSERPTARQLDRVSPWPNQQEKLFAFLTSKVAEFNWPPAKAVYVTSGPVVVCVGRRRTLGLCCGSRVTTCCGAGWTDYPCAYCGHRCCSHPCSRIL